MSEIVLTLPYPVNAPGVYRIEDAKSKRFYIGSSVNVLKRWLQHKFRLSRGTHPNPILQNIWSCDPERLSISTIQSIVGASREQLLAAEQKELDIAGVGTNPLCMNVLPIAGSHLGRKRSAETCERLAAAQRGKTASEEAKAKMRAAKIGKKLTLEHRRNLSDARRGVKTNRPKGTLNRKIRKFSVEDVLAMRALKNSGKSYADIMAIYPVSHGGLQKIIARQTYAEC